MALIVVFKSYDSRRISAERGRQIEPIEHSENQRSPITVDLVPALKATVLIVK
jgi:hypothetical protein